MPECADVVIVGGGIVGSSIAWHLTEAGCRSVLVIERETQQGKGSTGKSMGGVRAQFSSETNIRLSLYSIRFFCEFDERLDHPSGYRPQGYLFLATSETHLDYLRATGALQRSLSLESVCSLTTGEIARMVPPLRMEDVLGGSFCPTDGFVDPHSVMVGFMTRAAERGARLWRGVEVIGFVLDGDRVAGVETTRGRVATRTVVNAAGPWAARVAALGGIELPVEPLRRMLVPTEAAPLIPRDCPMVIDMSTGFHFRPEGLGVLMAWNDPDETPGFKTEFDPAFVEKILTRAAGRVPYLETVEVNPRRAWAGLYEITPDHYPVLGRVPQLQGFYLANGFSGHGVMHSPATGRILADLILHGSTSLIEVAPLGIQRFAEGRLLHETAVL